MSATALREKAAAIADATPVIVTHANIAAALVAALAELTVVAADQTANAGTYTYDYANLAGVVKLTRPVLARHGIVARTPVHGHGGGLAVTVKFLHVSGESIEDDPLPFPAGRDAQATGSGITYFRRYALLASLGLAAEKDDDDGAKAKHVAEPEFVWTAGAVKTRLIELLGDRTKAAEAWTNGHGDALTAWSPADADRLAALWRENQPVEDEPSLPLGDAT